MAATLPETEKAEQATEATRNDARAAWRVLAWNLVLFGTANGILFFRALSPAWFFVSIKHAYTFNTLVFPVVLAASGAYGLYAALHRRKRGPAGHKWLLRVSVLALVGSGAIAVLRIYASHIEPRLLQLRTVTIETPKVRRPVRILHISDIQSDRVGKYEERVFARIRALEPDLILHTGDLIQPVRPATIQSELPKITALLDTLKPPGGVFNVVGSVDGWMPDGLQIGGLQTLESRGTTVTIAGTLFRIYGLSHKWHHDPRNYRPTVEEWIGDGRPEDFTIVMGHSPDFVLGVKDLPIDLCLAGHTHGGQVRLPLFGPIITFSRVPRAWARGFREVDRTRLNVSAGIGSEHAADLPSIRFNCPPEMTLITLLPPKPNTERGVRSGE